MLIMLMIGPPGDSVVENSPFTKQETGSIPVLGRSPRERNGNPLQYSCLENPTDRGAWQATVHGVTVDGVTKRVRHDLLTKQQQQNVYD